MTLTGRVVSTRVGWLVRAGTQARDLSLKLDHRSTVAKVSQLHGPAHSGRVVTTQRAQFGRSVKSWAARNDPHRGMTVRSVKTPDC